MAYIKRWGGLIRQVLMTCVERQGGLFRQVSL